MARFVIGLLVVAGLSASVLLPLDGTSLAQPPGAQRGKIKKIDLEQMQLTLTIMETDRTLVLTEETRVLDVPGKDLKTRLQGFKEGTEVFVRVQKRDGKDVVFGMKRVDGPQPAPGGKPKFDSSKLKPLTEMGDEKYQGFAGGLYPGGKNERPAAHEAAGAALAKQMQPLDKDGKPSPEGKIVLLSLGMSNTNQASQGFQKAMDSFKDLNPRFLFVNGSQGGMTAAIIQNPDSDKGERFWTTVDLRLKSAGVTREQVQAVWIKQADAGPSQGFPGYAKKLQAELEKIVQLLPGRFPNIKMAYLSSRTYGGYAKTALNPEPYAFESGFSVQWLIAKQIEGDPDLNFDPKKGKVKAPWLSWGPYLWANGATKRKDDGFHYLESDFANDGTHHAAPGVQKLGNLMLDFFKTDSTTQPWFVAGPAQK